MTDQHAAISTARASAAANIEEQLLPILKELLGEIRKKATDESKWASLDKALQSDLETYTKLAANVRNSLMRQQWKGDNADFPEISRDCPKDPWLANIGMFCCFLFTLILQSLAKTYRRMFQETRIA